MGGDGTGALGGRGNVGGTVVNLNPVETKEDQHITYLTFSTTNCQSFSVLQKSTPLRRQKIALSVRPPSFPPHQSSSLLFLFSLFCQPHSPRRHATQSYTETSSRPFRLVLNTCTLHNIDQYHVAMKSRHFPV